MREGGSERGREGEREGERERELSAARVCTVVIVIFLLLLYLMAFSHSILTANSEGFSILCEGSVLTTMREATLEVDNTLQSISV